MATMKYAVVLTLLIQEVQGFSVKFTGSLGYNNTPDHPAIPSPARVLPATCADVLGTRVEGFKDKRLECMDLMCSGTGCGTDLATLVEKELNEIEADRLKESVKSKLAPTTGKVGFIWTGFVFPGQVYHDDALKWTDHSLSPKHTLKALLNGLTPISGYTLDMTPFGQYGMQLIPYDMCRVGKVYTCDEGPLFKKMWDKASELYAETILDGGTVGIIANGRSRDRLATGVMGKREIPRITNVLKRYQNRFEGKNFKAIVYNLMDRPVAGDIKCDELASTDTSNELKAFGEMRDTVLKAGGSYHCFDCSIVGGVIPHRRNLILEYGYNSLKHCIDAHRWAISA